MEGEAGRQGYCDFGSLVHPGAVPSEPALAWTLPRGAARRQSKAHITPRTCCKMYSARHEALSQSHRNQRC